MKYKNESIKNHKKQLKLLKKSNKKRKIPNYIWDSKNEENSNIMVKYFNNNKNYFTKKTLVDTVYPLINKAVNLIQMPNPNKEYSIINHIHQNKNNEEMNLSPPATENKTINNKKLSFNETIQNKIIFFLPELNNSKSLNYKKIVMDSFLTFSSLRQRKNCTQTNSDSICYINNYFSYKNKTSQVDNDCNYFFEGTRLRYVRIKAIKKKKRKPLKEVTLKKYYMKLQNDFNSKNLKSNNYILSNKREKVYILNYLINQSQKSSSIQNDNNILLLPSKLQKNKTYRSKTNLITKEKPKKKNKALKIYEIYDNPDEDKINYIKRVYKKKYKKLITNELENESYNSDNLNNSDEKNDIFYLEIYKTKNNVIDLNKNKRESSNNSIESIENHEKIIIEFIQKKYNIIDLNQRKIEFNRNIIENYSVPSEDASVINTADKSNFSSKINSINNFIPSLNTSIFNFSSSIMNMIDSKSSASLSISEITSKETVNRSEDNNSYICNCSSCISTNNNNTNACNNNNSNRYSSCSSNNNNNIILSELENEKIYLGTVKQSSDRTSISSYPNEDEVKINNNNYNNDNMKIKNKTLSLRSLLRSFSSPS
jgi:hypothetical protein